MKEPSASDALNKIEFDLPMDTPETCTRKYNQMRECLKNNKLKDINYRLEVLNQILALWEKYKSEVTLSNYLDLGITEYPHNLSNYCVVRNEITHAIKNLKSWVKPRCVDTPLYLSTSSCYVKPEPYGLALIFSAWNCNYLTLLVPLVQAIAAGNLVIAKPAQTASETCKVCLKILNELPKDVVVGCAGRGTHEVLLKLRWDLIIFTGSAQTGKIIHKAAAEYLTPTILELGGQNPVIVEKTADIKVAAYSIVYGRHMFNGQACIAPEYIMADKDIKDKLILEMKKVFELYFTKNPENSPELGKIVSDSHFERIKKLIENPGEGATLLYGDMSKINPSKKFIPPMLFGFDNMDQMGKSELAKAEIFGPVLYICPYNNIEECINYMNNKEKPLSAHLYTKDKKIKEYVRDNTSSGCLDINESLYHFSSSYLPFGGVGNSGMSAYHGKWGFDNMSHLKPVLDQASLLITFKYPPFNAAKFNILKRLVLFPYSRGQLIKFFIISIFLLIVVCWIYGKLFKK
jgi:aldehyde dehydrogenase (NAD+)